MNFFKQLSNSQVGCNICVTPVKTATQMYLGIHASCEHVHCLNPKSNVSGEKGYVGLYLVKVTV